MIYAVLFFAFFRIGMFAFGGAYGAIPLIQETVLSHGWMDEAMFTNMVAISESTPGPIMVNAATYIGSSQAGIAGAAAATLGVVLPSFLIILVITSVLRGFLKNPGVQAVLKGVKPCLMGIILATGVTMVINAVLWGSGGRAVDLAAAGILAVLVIVSVVVRRVKQREISPILLIVIAGVLGMVLY